MSKTDEELYDLYTQDSGFIYYYIKGSHVLHRVGGPALITPRFNTYFTNGVIDRKDGPALEDKETGNCEYYVDGKFLDFIKSDEQLAKYIKLLVFS